MLPEHLIALDRAWAARNREDRERADRPVPRCGICGISIYEGAKSEIRYTDNGEAYSVTRCSPCDRLERAAAMAKGA